MRICVIVTEIVFKDPSVPSTKKTTKTKPVSEKSSSLPEALSSSTQSESPKSSHQGRTAPPKTFPKIKVWIMSIDPAIKVTVCIKKPFPVSVSVLCVSFLSPTSSLNLFLLHIYTCPSFPHCVYSVFVLLIHIQESCHCWYLCRIEFVTYIASVLYKGLVLTPIP